MCTCGNFVREFNEALSCPWAWLLSGLLGDLLSVAPFCCQSVSAVCCLLLVCSSPDGRKSGGFLSPEHGGPCSGPGVVLGVLGICRFSFVCPISFFSRESASVPLFFLPWARKGGSLGLQYGFCRMGENPLVLFSGTWGPTFLAGFGPRRREYRGFRNVGAHVPVWQLPQHLGCCARGRPRPFFT